MKIIFNSASKIKLFKNDLIILIYQNVKIIGYDKKIYPLIFIDNKIMKPIIDEIFELNKKKFSKKMNIF